MAMKQTPAVLDVMTPTWEVATEYEQCCLFNEFCCLFLTRFFQHIALYKISIHFYSFLLNEKYLVQYTRMLKVL